MARTILLVEDNAAIAKMLMTAIDMWGYTARLATTADDALEIAQSYGRDLGLLICDVLLPDRPGTSVAAQIARLCPGIRTCFTSGYSFDILSQLGLLTAENLKGSRVSYIQKPFMPDEIRAVIERALQPRQAAAEVQHARVAC
jgi:DNA-binding NtrC family response regulator